MTGRQLPFFITRLLGEALFQIYVHVFEHVQLSPARIDRQPWFDNYEALTAVRIRMLNDPQAARRAPAVQVTVMLPVFADVIVLLIGEIAFGKELAGEIIQALPRCHVAFPTFALLVRLIVTHGFSLFRMSAHNGGDANAGAFTHPECGRTGFFR